MLRWLVLLGMAAGLAAPGAAQVPQRRDNRYSPTAGAPGPRPTPSEPARNPLGASLTSAPVRIAAGDLLEVSVFDTPELGGRARVNSQGNISLPLLGELAVRDLAPEQAAALIRQRLVERDLLKNPEVTVLVAEYAGQAVYVLGEVNRPGVYPLIGEHRLMDVLSAAGGLSPRADPLVSITPRQTPASRRQAQVGRDNPLIAAGDSIYVPPAGVVYVVGEVGRPGGFLLPGDEKLTVMKALALAEGTKGTAKLGGARLIRRRGQGREEIALNLKQILGGKAADPELSDQDILYIPGSAAKSGLKRGLEAALQATVGVVIYRL